MQNFRTRPEDLTFSSYGPAGLRHKTREKIALSEVRNPLRPVNASQHTWSHFTCTLVPHISVQFIVTLVGALGRGRSFISLKPTRSCSCKKESWCCVATLLRSHHVQCVGHVMTDTWHPVSDQFHFCFLVFFKDGLKHEECQRLQQGQTTNFSWSF